MSAPRPRPWRRPRTYQEWRHCITVECGLSLERDFIAARILALGDDHDVGTRRLTEQWGAAYVAQPVEWFRRARKELPD